MITGKNRIHLKVADSTQDHIRNLMEQGLAEDGTLVTAALQTHGRGMGGNVWQSEAGKNLMFSLLRTPTFLPARSFFLLNKFVALAVRDVLAEMLPQAEIRIKWPNDIYAGDRKICGMLIDNSIQSDRFLSSVIGIGLNVNQVEFSADLPNPVSMKLISGNDFDPERLLDRLCLSLEARYEQLKNQKRQLDQDYLSCLYRIEKWAEYEVEGRRIIARITGINPYGMLELKDKSDHLLVCDMKSVKFLFNE